MARFTQPDECMALVVGALAIGFVLGLTIAMIANGAFQRIRKWRQR